MMDDLYDVAKINATIGAATQLFLDYDLNMLEVHLVCKALTSASKAALTASLEEYEELLDQDIRESDLKESAR